MDIEEEMLKYVVGRVLDRCPDEMQFSISMLRRLTDKLTKLINSEFVRIDYEKL